MSTRYHFSHSSRPVHDAIACLAACIVLSCDYREPTLPNEFLLGPAVRLAITPGNLSLVTGKQQKLAAEAFDAGNRRVTAYVEWASSDPSVASVGQYDGLVTAVAVGEATVTASDGASLRATAVVTVRPPNPPAELHISPSELILQVPGMVKLTVTASDAAGQPTPVTVEWTTQDPGVATIDRVSGVLTAVGVGSTHVVASVGFVSSTILVRVEPPEFLMQWASAATASSEYGSVEWSASQATGASNVATCDEESRSWASLSSDMDWLELTYDVPVRPSEIRIHEVWSPGSIVKVEVRDLDGDVPQGLRGDADRARRLPVHARHSRHGSHSTGQQGACDSGSTCPAGLERDRRRAAARLPEELNTQQQLDRGEREGSLRTLNLPQAPQRSSRLRGESSFGSGHEKSRARP